MICSPDEVADVVIASELSLLGLPSSTHDLRRHQLSTVRVERNKSEKYDLAPNMVR